MATPAPASPTSCPGAARGLELPVALAPRCEPSIEGVILSPDGISPSRSPGRDRRARHRRRPCRRGPSTADLPVPDPADDARQRPDRALGAVRLAGDHRLLHGGPHRLAERGREGALGVRPLLRAHDVPRHREVPAGEVQRRPQVAGGRLQRVHDRRLDVLPHDGPVLGPGHGRRDRGRPVPEPQVRRAGVPEGGAGRPGRVQQERLVAVPDAQRGDAGHGLHDSIPTSTRRSASSPTSRTCPTSTPTARPSSTAGTGPRTARSSSPATSSTTSSSSWSARHYGGWPRGKAVVEIPAEPAAGRAAVGAR